MARYQKFVRGETPEQAEENFLKDLPGMDIWEIE